MLKKLFLLEFKQSYKVSLLFIGLQLLAFIFITLSATMLPVNPSNYVNEFLTIMLMFLSITIMVCSFLLFGAAPYGLFIYHGYRYYKNLYTDEGYLMHTLPCRPLDLFLSKLFTFSLWAFISTIASFTILILGIGACILIIQTKLDAIPYFSSLPDIFSTIIEELVYMFEILGIELFMLLIPLLIYLLTFISGLFFTIGSFYFSISIGQFAKKFKLAASIGIYIALFSIVQSVNGLISFFSMMFTNNYQMSQYNYNSTNAFMHANLTYLPSCIVMAIFAVGFLWGSYYIMKNKLNLE